MGGGVGSALLLIGHHEGRVLLLGDAHVVAGVRRLHDVSRPRVQEDGLLVELGQLGRPHGHQRHAVPAHAKAAIENTARLASSVSDKNP